MNSFTFTREWNLVVFLPLHVYTITDVANHGDGGLGRTSFHQIGFMADFGRNYCHFGEHRITNAE